jgi:predicted ArsR family transcriptional regulator
MANFMPTSNDELEGSYTIGKTQEFIEPEKGTREKILELLEDGEKTTNQITKAIKLTRSGIWYMLDDLETKGIIKSRYGSFQSVKGERLVKIYYKNRNI